MKIPESFEFVSRKFDEIKREAVFNYTVRFSDGEALKYQEKLFFPKDRKIRTLPKKLLNDALDDLHFVLGVSYYKLFCPGKFIWQRRLSEGQAAFWNVLYRDGLGEFYYRNNLNPKNSAEFTASSEHKDTLPTYTVKNSRNRALVGVGGGKESIVVMEMMKKGSIPPTAFVLEAKSSAIINEVIKVMDVPALRVRRELDEKLFSPVEGAFNGHVPISAIIAFTGYFSALLYDYAQVIVGNEYSSNFGNIEFRGMSVNHQWSKSQIFENLFRKYSNEFLTDNIQYYSALRPYYELRIAGMFAKHKNYFPHFSSCNRNFTIKKASANKWCGECPKCVFVFTILAAHLRKKELLEIFGENLFEKPSLLPLFNDLSGFGNLKPFDCVGTFEEMQAALKLASKKHSGALALKVLLPKIRIGDEEIKKIFQAQQTELAPYYYFLGVDSVLLVGYGREGRETKKYLRNNFPSLKIGVADIKQGKDYLNKQKNYDFAVKTAGITKRYINIAYTTATEIFFSEIPKRQIIGVTGTKGKSTTATLVYEMLKAGKKKARLLGNIGKPMLAALETRISADELIVLELSSYQLDDLRQSPHVALIVNLFPEHMDYHGSETEYYAAKKNIINFQRSGDYFIYNDKDRRLKEWALDAKSQPLPFAEEIPVKEEEIPLLGNHNRDNIRAAIAAVRLFNVSDAAIAAAIKNFEPLRHRLELVGKFNGINFYDDAISTTPESTLRALEALSRVDTIFLGGHDRGYDFTELRSKLKQYGVKNVVLFPDSGKRILGSREEFCVLETRNMSEAVKFAFAHTPKDGICLLSTASPSFGIWKDFEEKGEEYKKYVEKLGKNSKRF